MKAKYLMVSGLGMASALASYPVIAEAMAALPAQETSEVAYVLLILGSLLAFGGTRVAFVSMKHLRSAAA